MDKKPHSPARQDDLRQIIKPAAARHTCKTYKRRAVSGSKARYAAVDLGTNNCRLLIAEAQAHGFRVRDSFSRIVRLGEGLSHSGVLSEDAMARTIAALHICAAKIRKHNVRRIRCVATEACRQAQNGAGFITRVRRETGLRLEIINGKTEAALAAQSCEALFDPHAQTIIVFDIGGGSSELTRLDRTGGNRFDIRDTVSLPLGVVRLAERHSGCETDIHGYAAMCAECAEKMADFFARHTDLTDLSKIQFIGTSGTVTTLAAIQKGLPAYDRRKIDGIFIAAKHIYEVIADLRTQSRHQLAQNRIIGREKADLVLAGCAVFETLHKQWPVENIHIADRGLREGMLMRMMRRDRKRNQYRHKAAQKKTQNDA